MQIRKQTVGILCAFFLLMSSTDTRPIFGTLFLGAAMVYAWARYHDVQKKHMDNKFNELKSEVVSNRNVLEKAIKEGKTEVVAELKAKHNKLYRDMKNLVSGQADTTKKEILQEMKKNKMEFDKTIDELKNTQQKTAQQLNRLHTNLSQQINANQTKTQEYIKTTFKKQQNKIDLKIDEIKRFNQETVDNINKKNGKFFAEIQKENEQNQLQYKKAIQDGNVVLASLYQQKMDEQNRLISTRYDATDKKIKIIEQNFTRLEQAVGEITQNQKEERERLAEARRQFEQFKRAQEERFENQQAEVEKAAAERKEMSKKLQDLLNYNKQLEIGFNKGLKNQEEIKRMMAAVLLGQSGEQIYLTRKEQNIKDYKIPQTYYAGVGKNIKTKPECATQVRKIMHSKRTRKILTKSIVGIGMDGMPKASEATKGLLSPQDSYKHSLFTRKYIGSTKALTFKI